MGGLSNSNDERGVSLEHNPDSCFTTIAFNPVNGLVTGVFQNTSEGDVERLTLMNSRNISLSGRLKGGKELDEVIAELEKTNIRGGRMGVMVDEAVMPSSNGQAPQNLRYSIEGATTHQGLLTALYVTRFITESGKNLNTKEVEEKMDMYFQGGVSLRSIVISKGKLTLEEGHENGRPSILGKVKKLKLPEEITEKKCVEC